METRLYSQYTFSDDLSMLGAVAMSEVVPTTLVKRLKCNLHQGFDSKASCRFNIF